MLSLLRLFLLPLWLGPVAVVTKPEESLKIIISSIQATLEHINSSFGQFKVIVSHRPSQLKPMARLRTFSFQTGFHSPVALQSKTQAEAQHITTGNLHAEAVIENLAALQEGDEATKRQ